MKLSIYVLILFNSLFSEAELSANKDTLIVGEHIEAHFNDLNSYGSDWIGIFSINASNEEYLYWQYTDGTQNNNYNFISSGFINFSPISLSSGQYELRLFYNNNYELISSYPFTVIDNCNTNLSSDFEDTFNVMTFNTWYSAQYGYGGLGRVAEIITELDIDIIGFQETNPGSIIEIKSLLYDFDGYEELFSTPSESNISIISRFPIIDTIDYNLYGVGANVLISNYDTLKFISSHLTAYPYGPYDLYQGVSSEDVINNELSTRYIENLDIYNQIITNHEYSPNLPIIYVGDHNTPSILDWGENNINQNFGFQIDWPVSQFLLNNGFYDSYRYIHPLVENNIGLTWSPGYPKNTFDNGEIHDRIDMIYFKNGYSKNLYPLNSYIYDCDPWPSDHRAVVTEFAMCFDVEIGDINLDFIINILDILSLVNEILYSSNLYCLYIYGDIDNNQELNITDIIQLVSLILN
ncbi:MAG: hypothetical protein CMF96_00060 [Candidatus Marinimicrobia bacterium]|nr:hypothetical protein [Candidatus Neomarinimicrobiota bacterium]|tara:strand:+ start:9064 stop:10458 length:1395 start_codon:yes stop_codon:yes gene_type:complete